jgi:uncharacterized protein YjbI with pentapeptide repeats
MNEVYTEGEQFEGIEYQKDNLPKGEYEHCTFRNCKFSASDLNGIKFVACKFEDCDFSMAKFKGSSFRDVQFISCKILGARFDECNPLLLSFTFQRCVLNFSSFHKLKLKGTVFKECRLEEVEFAEADLTNVKFERCDLTRASFENTMLTGTDFRSASNYSIDPERNQMKKARFSYPGVTGLLDKYGIIIE